MYSNHRTAAWFCPSTILPMLWMYLFSPTYPNVAWSWYTNYSTCRVCASRIARIYCIEKLKSPLSSKGMWWVARYIISSKSGLNISFENQLLHTIFYNVYLQILHNVHKSQSLCVEAFLSHACLSVVGWGSIRKRAVVPNTLCLRSSIKEQTSGVFKATWGPSLSDLKFVFFTIPHTLCRANKIYKTEHSKVLSSSVHTPRLCGSSSWNKTRNKWNNNVVWLQTRIFDDLRALSNEQKSLESLHHCSQEDLQTNDWDHHCMSCHHQNDVLRCLQDAASFFYYWDLLSTTKWT